MCKTFKGKTKFIAVKNRVSSLRINKRCTTTIFPRVLHSPDGYIGTRRPHIPSTSHQYFYLQPFPTTSGFRRNRTSAPPFSFTYWMAPSLPSDDENGKSSVCRKRRRSFRLDGIKSGHYFSILFPIFRAYYMI